uniref:Uncharacterized protein n=1 Tax=Wuchereria bancrofti TaxID=6293 RepID=A0A1I8E9U9_WUCBA
MYYPSILHCAHSTLFIHNLPNISSKMEFSAVDSCLSSTAKILSYDPGTHARAFVFDVTEKVQVFTLFYVLLISEQQTFIGYFSSKAVKQLFSDSEIGGWALFLSFHLTYIPDFRLRFWLKRTWYIYTGRIKHCRKTCLQKPFLCACLEATYRSVRQLLLIVIEELSKRLQSKWKQLAALEYSDDVEPSQEQLLVEHVACILTENAQFLCRIYLLNERCDEGIAVFMLVKSIQRLQIHGAGELAVTHLLSLVFYLLFFGEFYIFFSSFSYKCTSMSHILLRAVFQSVSGIAASIGGFCRRDRKIESMIVSMKCNKDFANEKRNHEEITANCDSG